MQSKRETQRFFDRWIAEKSRHSKAKVGKLKLLSWFYQTFLEDQLRIAIAEIAKSTKGNILDAGCGEGKHTFQLTSVTDEARIIGLDLSSKSLEAAKLRAYYALRTKVDFVHGDATILPFKSKSFDAVLAINVLHHSGMTTLKEIRRILRRDGQLLVFEITSNNPLVQIGRKVFQVGPKYFKASVSEKDCFCGETQETMHYHSSTLKKAICDFGFIQLWERQAGLFIHLIFYVFDLLPAFIHFVYLPALIAVYKLEEKLITNTPLGVLCSNRILKFKA